MLTVLNRQEEASPEVLVKDVRKAIDDFAGYAEQFDDITMLCIQYNG